MAAKGGEYPHAGLRRSGGLRGMLHKAGTGRQMIRKPLLQKANARELLRSQLPEGDSGYGSGAYAGHGANGIDAAPSESVGKEGGDGRGIVGIQPDRVVGDARPHPLCGRGLIQPRIDVGAVLPDSAVRMDRRKDPSGSRMKGVLSRRIAAEKADQLLSLDGGHARSAPNELPQIGGVRYGGKAGGLLAFLLILSEGERHGLRYMGRRKIHDLHTILHEDTPVRWPMFLGVKEDPPKE